jgi:choline-sulfatase
VDVMPTVLDLLDLAQPPTDGASLVGLMRGRTSHLDLEAYSETLYPQRFGMSPLRSLRAGRFKLIDAPRPELYDLERDPFEQRSIYQERRGLASMLERRLVALERSTSLESALRDAPAPSADVRQRLASLGYIGSTPPRASSDRDDLPEPKDCVSDGLLAPPDRSALNACATLFGDEAISQTAGVPRRK